MPRKLSFTKPIPLPLLINKIRQSQEYLKKGMEIRDKLETMRQRINRVRDTEFRFQVNPNDLIMCGLARVLPEGRQMIKPADHPKRVIFRPDELPFLLNEISQQIDYCEKTIQSDRRDVFRWTREYRKRMPMAHRAIRILQRTTKRNPKQNLQRVARKVRSVLRK